LPADLSPATPAMGAGIHRFVRWLETAPCGSLLKRAAAPTIGSTCPRQSESFTVEKQILAAGRFTKGTAMSVGIEQLLFHRKTTPAEFGILAFIAESQKSLNAGDPSEAERLARRAFDAAVATWRSARPIYKVAAGCCLLRCLAVMLDRAGMDETLARIESSVFVSSLPRWHRLELQIWRAIVLSRNFHFDRAIRKLQPLVYPSLRRKAMVAVSSYFLPSGETADRRLATLITQMTFQLGAYYHSAARHGDAVEALKQFLSRNMGTPTAEYLRREEYALVWISKSEILRGNADGAAWAYSALTEREARPGSSATGMAMAAEIAYLIGRKEAAEEWLEKASVLAAAEAAKPQSAKADLELAVAFGAIGLSLLAVGEAAKAEASFQKQWEVCQRLVIRDKSADILIRKNIGVARRDQGFLDEALAQLNQALAMQESVPVPDHRLTALLLRDIAVTYHRLGRNQAAADALRRSISIVSAWPDGDETRHKVLQTRDELGT